MTTESQGIYHWKLGEVALARMCKNVYAKVRVIKDEKGLFFDDKVLGISCNEDGSLNITDELCYFVETCRTNEKLWLPYTSMHLAERSRPFYGAKKVPPGKVKTEPSKKKSPGKVDTKQSVNSTPKKKDPKYDYTLPLDVEQNTNRQPDLNTKYEANHVPQKQGKYANRFQEFVRLGKDKLYDHYFQVLQQNVSTHSHDLAYLENANVSTEDKLEFVVNKTVTEKELDNYLKQCWRFNHVKQELEKETTKSQTFLAIETVRRSDVSDNEDTSHSPQPPAKLQKTVHIPWCLVCGKAEDLLTCTKCAASFHQACRKDWLKTVVYRKTPESTIKPVMKVQKKISSTRTISSVKIKEKDKGLCPSCQWGPTIGYEDVVWHKLSQCPWWPARVLPPGEVPACLRAKDHSPRDWPLRYYGTLNHGWGAVNRICLFFPSHTAQLGARQEDLRDAVMDASDDYITVYLT